MKRCECYHEMVRKEKLLCCPTPVSVKYGYCTGTREMDVCNCGGDMSRCDFYPEVRQKADTMKDESTADGVKSCPCCAGEAEIKETVIYTEDAFFVRCKACGLRTNIVFVDHPLITKNGVDESTRYTAEQAKAKAIALWNQRA